MSHIEITTVYIDAETISLIKKEKKKARSGHSCAFHGCFLHAEHRDPSWLYFLFLWTGNKSFKEAAYKDRDTDRERYYIDGFDMSKGNEKKRRRAECASCKTRNAHFLSSPTFAHSNLIGGLDKTRGTAS